MFVYFKWPGPFFWTELEGVRTSLYPGLGPVYVAFRLYT